MRGRGFTLVEILVALGIAGLLLGVVLSTTLGHRQLYVLDTNRTAANQNLRASLDILVADLRQAGERLPLDFPAVEVRNDGTELVLRRNLFDVVLNLCDRNGISGNQDIIPVAQRNFPPNAPTDYIEACRFRDEDNNGFDDRIDAWRNYRCGSDGDPTCQTGNRREVVRAYIHDPNTGLGEWFDYDHEDGEHIHKDNASRWQNSYGPLSRLYLLEERRYYLSGNVLMLAENGGTGKGLVGDVVHFQVRARAGNRTYTNFPPAGLSWTSLEHVEVAIRSRLGNVERALSTQAVPRNVFSR
ncbi:PilW family protein [Thermus sediminis]|uniref:PilW family protein n=1 Tax=Thermus sediminis TaxID=1761908 RepID=UPI000E3CF2DC|nr:prepilin-type N-terminal cleavage/methylation domain-containing protein [Thermus sediminis]